jgi:hypothetical protein
MKVNVFHNPGNHKVQAVSGAQGPVMQDTQLIIETSANSPTNNQPNLLRSRTSGKTPVSSARGKTGMNQRRPKACPPQSVVTKP